MPRWPMSFAGAAPDDSFYTGRRMEYDSGNPTWSPDGRKIAFDARRDGNTDIYVMNADGSGLTQMTNGPGYDGMPSWTRY
jgi:Tol biopolymer transport system component